MNLIASFLLLATFATAESYSQSPNSMREVVGAHTTIRRAVTSKNKSSLIAGLADDFLNIGSSGQTANKTEFINGGMAPENAEVSSRIDDVRVQIYGNVAVLTCRVTIRDALINGVFSHLRWVKTNVFVRERNRWRLVLAQDTEIRRS